MKLADLVAFLRKNELFSYLTDEEIERLAPFTKSVNYEKEDVILNEGDKGEELYIIEKGSVGIIKWIDQKAHQYHTLEKIEKGNYFGEMARIENRKRSASVIALSPVELVMVDLEKLSRENELSSLYSKIMNSLGQKISERLRKTGNKLVDSLTERLALTEAHDQISKTLVYVFIGLAIWFTLAKINMLFPTDKEVYKNVIDPLFTSLFIFLSTLLVIYLIQISKKPYSFYGFSMKNWFWYSAEAVFYSIPLILFFIGMKWVFITFSEAGKDTPLFDLKDLASNYHEALILAGIYIVFAPLQEFVVRGFLQTSFRNFFQGHNAPLLAIITSNLLFHVLHFTKDFGVAISSLFLGFFWGFLFEKQKTVVGVSVSHVLLGFFNFFILDLTTIFNKVFNIVD